MIKEIIFLCFALLTLSAAVPSPDEDTTEKDGKIIIIIPGDSDDDHDSLKPAESARPQWGWGGYHSGWGRGGWNHGYRYPGYYGGGWERGWGYGWGH